MEIELRKVGLPKDIIPNLLPSFIPYNKIEEYEQFKGSNEQMPYMRFRDKLIANWAAPNTGNFGTLMNELFNPNSIHNDPTIAIEEVQRIVKRVERAQDRGGRPFVISDEDKKLAVLNRLAASKKLALIIYLKDPQTNFSEFCIRCESISKYGTDDQTKY